MSSLDSRSKLIDYASDLLKRHVSSHNDAGSGSNKRQKVSQPARPRIPQACVACAEAKLRCEGPAPCRRCQQKNLSCSYSVSRQKRFTSLAKHSEPAVDVAEASQDTSPQLDTNRQPLMSPSNVAVVGVEDHPEPSAQSDFDTCT